MIELNSEDGDIQSVYVIEQLRLGGADYLLVCDEPSGDAEAWILKDVSGSDEADACYVAVTDEDEIKAVSGVFEDMLEDVEIR